jgi:hypothetical protein
MGISPRSLINNISMLQSELPCLDWSDLRFNLLLDLLIYLRIVIEIFFAIKWLHNPLR